jgi:hypothetical protein
MNTTPQCSCPCHQPLWGWNNLPCHCQCICSICQFQSLPRFSEPIKQTKLDMLVERILELENEIKDLKKPKAINALFGSMYVKDERSDEIIKEVKVY